MIKEDETYLKRHDVTTYTQDHDKTVQKYVW